jgi:hypothetical protein
MAAVTPSPDVSPVSAATTNGHFPRDQFCLNLSNLPDASNFVLKSTLKSPHLLDSPTGLFPSPGILNGSFKKRPRNMSQSSGTDREMSHDTTSAPSNSTAPTSNGEPRPTTKKRPSTDTIDYPRRRATIAVCVQTGASALDLTSPVRDLPLPQVSLRRLATQVQTVH